MRSLCRVISLRGGEEREDPLEFPRGESLYIGTSFVNPFVHTGIFPSPLCERFPGPSRDIFPSLGGDEELEEEGVAPKVEEVVVGEVLVPAEVPADVVLPPGAVLGMIGSVDAPVVVIAVGGRQQPPE